MRIPITRDGWGVLFACSLGLAVVGAALSLVSPWHWAWIGVLWLWVVLFFRDPERAAPRRSDVLYSPADGKITEVAELPHHDLIGGPCIRVRIFLSLFNVHINRMPCAGSVSIIRFEPGKFLNAMKAGSAEVNESNTLIVEPQLPFRGPMVLRQIAGMVARTIVCHAEVGQNFEAGQRFGMIKFGSGTEVVVAKQPGLQVLIGHGVSVKAGLTPLMEMS